MDVEDSQLLADDSTFEEIFVKYEPNSPISSFESIGNVEKFSLQPPGKILKMEDSGDNNETISEPSRADAFISPEKRKKRHVLLDPFEKDIMNILEGNRSKIDYSIRDPDAMFFISHVPVIKQLNPKEKLDFQVKFMQLLQSYHFPSVKVAIENQAHNVSSEIIVDDDPIVGNLSV
uniref:BESS domain-containing protein n=2 Tax=Lygus hesperus TaxID=30085 RepID=A0A146L6V4_LYGHE